MVSISALVLTLGHEKVKVKSNNEKFIITHPYYQTDAADLSFVLFQMLSIWFLSVCVCFGERRGYLEEILAVNKRLARNRISEVLNLKTILLQPGAPITHRSSQNFQSND